MTWARPDTIQRLFQEACRMPVVDSHTHVQDDLTGFDEALASQNLAGTQAAVNASPNRRSSPTDADSTPDGGRVRPKS